MTTTVTKPLTIYNSALASASNVTFALGKAAVSNQTAEITFTYSSTAGSSNLSLGHFSSSTILNILSGGNVGVGTATPAYKLDVNGSLNATSLYLNGSIVSSTSTEINTLAGVTAGTATASKALIIDSSKNVIGINSLSANIISCGTNASAGDSELNVLNTTSNCRIRLGSALSTNNVMSLQWNYSSLGSATNFLSFDPYGTSGALVVTCNNSIGINQTTPTANFHVKANGTFTSGGFEIAQRVTNSNATPIALETQFSSGAASTSTNSAYLGTTTNNDFRLMSNNATRMTITAAGRIGIGTTTPVVPLEITTFVSYNTGGGYAFLNSVPQTGSSGAATNSYSAKFTERILVGNEINIVSDYRIKKDIVDLSIGECKAFILKTNPVKYKFKKDEYSTHYGYIAQDIYKAGFTDLISMGPDSSVEEIIEEDGFINPKGSIFTLSLEQITPILAKNIKCIYDEKEMLEIEVGELKDKIKEQDQRLQKIEELVASLLDK